MREFKFRVWNKNEEIMYSNEILEMRTKDDMYGFIEKGIYLDLGEKDFIHMQYTGLKDKNGKEIYEGDIVESEKENRYQVVFNRGCFKAQSIDHPNFNLYLLGYIFLEYAEVIGNIYENPELLG